MGIKFKSSKKSFKKKLRLTAPFICMGVVAVVILGILILPNKLEIAGRCNNLGIGGGSFFSEGCSKSFDEIIFVVGDTANTPKPSLNYPDYIKLAYSNSENGGIYAMSVSKPSKSPRAIPLDDENEDISTSVDKYIDNMSATQNGADYLEAIRTAAGFAEDKERTLIYVIGSGLSDKGLLNFADDKLLLDDRKTEEIIDQVVEKIDRPNELKGITIFWDGIGKAVLPQEDLPANSSDKIKQIYSGIIGQLKGLKKSGNSIIIKDKGSVTGVSASTNTRVKISQFPHEKIDINITFGEEETTVFQFKGGENAFVDETSTVAKIQELTSLMQKYPNAEATITIYVSRGRTCRSTPDEELIHSRIERVKNAFIGVDSSRVNVKSGGFGPEQECGNDGQFLGEEIARKNRKVEITIKEK